MDTFVRFVRPDWRGRVQHVYGRRTTSRKAADKWSRLISDSELIDPDCIVNLDPGEHEPPQVAAKMMELGADGLCLVIASGYGSLVVDESGIVTFYEGEGPSDRFLLRLPTGSG
jgi:hypothetical protein